MPISSCFLNLFAIFSSTSSSNTSIPFFLSSSYNLIDFFKLESSFLFIEGIITMSNGGFFIFRKKLFKQINNRIGKSPYYYTLNIPENIEIDNSDDLELARLVEKGLCK